MSLAPGWYVYDPKLQHPIDGEYHNSEDAKRAAHMDGYDSELRSGDVEIVELDKRGKVRRKLMSRVTAFNRIEAHKPARPRRENEQIINNHLYPLHTTEGKKFLQKLLDDMGLNAFTDEALDKLAQMQIEYENSR